VRPWAGNVSLTDGLPCGDDELILIAQEWERKSSKDQATRYWRQGQAECKGARNAREMRRILERGYCLCFLMVQRWLRSGSRGHCSFWRDMG